MSPADITTEIERWFIERIACGPIARDTPAYNQALVAKEDLKARLALLLAPAAPMPEPPAPEPTPAPPQPEAAAPAPEPQPAAEPATRE